MPERSQAMGNVQPRERSHLSLKTLICQEWLHASLQNPVFEGVFFFFLPSVFSPTLVSFNHRDYSEPVHKRLASRCFPLSTEMMSIRKHACCFSVANAYKTNKCIFITAIRRRGNTRVQWLCWNA